MADFKEGDRIIVLGKNTIGKIAFIGYTHFLDEKCFGVILDEPKGRNNGSVEGIRYFKCSRNHGIFVRSCQIQKMSQNENKVTKISDNTRIIYPNYLRNKKASQRPKSLRNRRKLALVSKTTHSDTNLTSIDSTIFQNDIILNGIEQNIPQQELDREDFDDFQTKELESVKQISCSSSPTLNLRIPYMKDSGAKIVDYQNMVKFLVGELSKAKENILQLETELKQSRKTIESNRKDQNYMIQNERQLKDQLGQFKKQAYALQKKISKMNKEKCELDKKIKSLEQVKEQLNEITENVIIEKEISELTMEQKEIELQDLTTKYQILQLELQIKEEEMELQCENKVPTVHYVQQLEHQNKVYYNALLKLKCMYVSKQENLQGAEKTIANNLSELDQLSLSRDNLQNLIVKLNHDISDMHETIDCFISVDDLVFEITDRSLYAEHMLTSALGNLKVLEEYLDVSNELEEVLQDINKESSKDLATLELRVNITERALVNMVRLVNDYKQTFQKYRSLISDLRWSNKELQFRLDMAINERQQAVMEAENLKLRIHRESKKTLQHLIKDDMVKIENDISQQQIEYWAMYLPKHFFGGYEHLALQGKLLLSKMIKKVNILYKYLNIRCFDNSFLTKQNHLQLFTFQTYFSLKICTLQNLLKAHYASLDHVNIESFLAFGAHCEILITKDKEIDRYLDDLSKNELDTARNMISLNNILKLFSQLFNSKFCPENEKEVLSTKCCLKMISSGAKCINEYSNFFNSFFESNSSIMKEKFKILEHQSSIVIRNTNYLLNYVTNVKDGEKAYYDENSVCRLRNVFYKIEKIMEFVINLYDKISDTNNKFDNAYLFNECNSLELHEIAGEVQSICNLARRGENLELYQPKPPTTMLSFKSWICNRRDQKEKLIKDLQRKVLFYEEKLEIIHEERQKPEQSMTRVFQEKSVQTDIYEKDNVHPISRSVCSTLPIKLQDMEKLTKFVHYKIFQKQMENMKRQMSSLPPLNIVSKRKKYHQKVNRLIIFQRILRGISADLMRIILPSVVDISSEDRKQKYFQISALMERNLIKQDIQKRLANLEIQVHDFKNENCFSRKS
ncbi:dynactin subunit 1 [Trichonephila inaurata madagascariensis]|uniref:Dynactin subunit 1 n=1 Tax=Trichonephila inaurata madagascariensis TaxID=2747483 RepID=A0A8X6XR07_9ARAC|nr:dynactin subunit 1 [Trichonephila inaurata madagascariensis]